MTKEEFDAEMQKYIVRNKDGEIKTFKNKEEAIMYQLPNVRAYELDFGDTNLIGTADLILGWIKTDMENLKPEDDLGYTITTRMMSEQELDELPEWS